MSPNSQSDHLRNSPRQARSAARVELLLDAAAEVFEEVGFDAATTNLVASRADVPVGTLYRWFPDKGALAEALTDRYLEALDDLYRKIASEIAPQEPIGRFIDRSIRTLATEIGSQRALPALLVSAMVPGKRSTAGERLRAGLLVHVTALIDLRVPGVPTDVRDETADVCVTLAHLAISAAADAADDSSRSNRMLEEYVDVLIAYLEAKFPSADSPAWTDPEVAVKPRFPAPNRNDRVAAAPTQPTAT